MENPITRCKALLNLTHMVLAKKWIKNTKKQPRRKSLAIDGIFKTTFSFHRHVSCVVLDCGEITE